jgi:hypothetical protein
MLDKGNVISFTFVGGSDEELTDLISGLSFVGRAATAKRR